LAARLGKQGAIDKKVERQIRLDLTERCKQKLDEFIKDSSKSQSSNVVRECRLAFATALNLLSLKQNCFLGFEGDQATIEDWTVRIRANVLLLALKESALNSNARDEKEKITKDLLEILFGEQG
jgi:hypothetical protein